MQCWSAWPRFEEAKSPYRIRIIGQFGASAHPCFDEAAAQVNAWRMDVNIGDRPAGGETVVAGVDPDSVNPETLEVRINLAVRLTGANYVADGSQARPAYTVAPRTPSPFTPGGNEWGCRVTPAYTFYITPKTPYDIGYLMVSEQKTAIVPTDNGAGAILKTVRDGVLNPWDMDPTKPGRQTKGVWQFGLDLAADPPVRPVKRHFQEEYLP